MAWIDGVAVQFALVPEPCLDPLDPRMSGANADPVLIGVVLDAIYRQVEACYPTAQFENDPVSTRANRYACDAVAAIRFSGACDLGS